MEKVHGNREVGYAACKSMEWNVNLIAVYIWLLMRITSTSPLITVVELVFSLEASNQILLKFLIEPFRIQDNNSDPSVPFCKLGDDNLYIRWCV
ncbi:hypothetical protein JAAARDRAFT_32243 [Jaapia argillacea MUCL 33604]|uniref:Uncharacterized protein n=1 Tax=Jaapia argillacea MUCL 33604 TaxID=933084 RepID=A0A067QCL2_9AGAM|nr:hypothetical protein JAAARDRAFT_32243 [Jaapia argillacea MUCL 33604]